MITPSARRFYRTLLENCKEIPETSTQLLYERIELLRHTIALKFEVKLNLISLYSSCCFISIVSAVTSGNLFFVASSIVFSSLIVVIVEDYFELQNMAPSLDKLKDPAVAQFKPVPIGPFWY